MKIYTKKGDDGTTQLLGGKRVPKHHVKIEAYGTVDELNSHIGLLRDQNIAQSGQEFFITIQDRLFVMGGMLALDDGHAGFSIPNLEPLDIEVLEKEIDLMETTLPEMKNFVLPGGHSSVSFCHIARCVCRRAERNITHLSEIENVDPLIIQYLNRLSDFLFVLSRKWAQELNSTEIPWKPRG
ncbi:MAG: cob(I)yrinic acid a,c-diamide adenosyltransferase [Flavobacteriales bacterium]|nr:cob(I)yrinic acid a,c-diamide adenosyltransferase [Flavobacteriales bacterium]